jgi:hypothetical protein
LSSFFFVIHFRFRIEIIFQLVHVHDNSKLTWFSDEIKANRFFFFASLRVKSYKFINSIWIFRRSIDSLHECSKIKRLFSLNDQIHVNNVHFQSHCYVFVLSTSTSHLVISSSFSNQASLLDSLNNSSVNRIFRFIDHAQIFSERIEKWARDLRRKFYWTIHEEIHFMIFTSRLEDDIKTTSRRIEIDIEALYLVDRRIQIDFDVS